MELFDCMENFLRRLCIHTQIPYSMAEMAVKIMVELLSVLALATTQIKEGRFRESTHTEALASTQN